MRTILTVVAGLALAACSSNNAPPKLDAANSATSLSAQGLSYAQQACASCHAVTATERSSPSPNAPSFVAIANLPGMTPTALNAWLHSAHMSMPLISVSSEDRARLFAYLETLRRQKSSL